MATQPCTIRLVDGSVDVAAQLVELLEYGPDTGPVLGYDKDGARTHLPTKTIRSITWSSDVHPDPASEIQPGRRSTPEETDALHKAHGLRVPDGDDTDPADSNWYDNAEYRYGPPSVAAWARAQVVAGCLAGGHAIDTADEAQEAWINNVAELIVNGSYPRPPVQ